MPKLFQVLPLTLFRPLAAPGAEIYTGILLSLFAQAGRHHQPLSRELAMDTVLAIISDPHALDLTQDAALDDDPPAEAQADADVVRVRAGAILRYLKRCGWLRVESQSDFSQAVIWPGSNYSARLPVPVSGTVNGGQAGAGRPRDGGLSLSSYTR